jgi:hypothetical protein
MPDTAGSMTATFAAKESCLLRSAGVTKSMVFDASTSASTNTIDASTEATWPRVGATIVLPVPQFPVSIVSTDLLSWGVFVEKV